MKLTEKDIGKKFVDGMGVIYTCLCFNNKKGNFIFIDDEGDVNVFTVDGLDAEGFGFDYRLVSEYKEPRTWQEVMGDLCKHLNYANFNTLDMDKELIEEAQHLIEREGQ